MKKKLYIHPALSVTPFVSELMQVPESLPQGHSNDPKLNEDDQLSKDDFDDESVWED